MNDLSLKQLIQKLLRHKRALIISAILGFVLGAVVAFSIPKEYLSKSSLVVESNENSGLGNSSLASMASMAGINIPKSSDAIAPELYPSVIETDEFLVKMLYSNVRPKGSKKEVLYIDYIRKYQKLPWWRAAVKGLMDMLPKDSTKNVVRHQINPQELTTAEDALLKIIKKNVLCTLDTEDDVINIQVSAQDPYVAKQLVDVAAAHLQDFITQYRTNKARIDLGYYEKLRDESLQKYKKIQKEYADYSDTHTDLALKSYIVESDKLENDMQLAYNEYSQLCNQVTMASAKVQERTPAFTVLQKPSVPVRPFSPQKKLIVAAYIFVFFSLTAVYILFFSERKKKAEEVTETEPEEA